MFDDHYRTANPGKADFLLLPDWQLPDGGSDDPTPDLSTIDTDLIEPRGDGEGVLYVFREAPGSDNLLDKNECDRAWRVEGVRVPDLARYVLRHPQDEDANGYCSALTELRDALLSLLANPTGEGAGFLLAIRDQPTELTHWNAYSDWLVERNLLPAGLHLLDQALRYTKFTASRDTRNPVFDRVQVTTYLAQACKHEGRWYRKPMTDTITRHDTFEQSIFFDDRWAAAHPALAAGVLTFASRWDVLT